MGSRDKMNQFSFPTPSDIDLRQHSTPALAIARILTAGKRQMWVVAISILAALALALFHISQITPRYSSSVSILIDTANVALQADASLANPLAFEAGAIDSQLEILTSDKIAYAVATRLGLQNNVDFIDPRPSLLQRLVRDLKGTIGQQLARLNRSRAPVAVRDMPGDVRLRIAGSILQNNLRVSRAGRTYVLVLEYTDANSALAQAIAAQYADAYLEDQLNSKFDATKRATNWMEGRMRELKERSLAADEAVQRYRADHNLTMASGRLIDEQRLTDATTQLTLARANLDAANARYQRLKMIIDSKDLSGSLIESMGKSNISDLRSKYLAAAKLASEITARYGADHQAAIKARADMAEYQRLIFDELTNLLPGYQSEAAIAQANVDSIQNTIDGLRQTTTSNDSAMVELRSLEQEAASLKTLYSSFLQKFQETQQQQSFPITNARVISDASVPSGPSSPKKLMLALTWLMAGCFAGGALAAIREWRDRGFRTATQVREELNLEFISNVPTLPNALIPRPKEMFVGLPLHSEIRRVRRINPLLRHIVDEPFSMFSEAIRNIKLRINYCFPKRKSVIIGVVSLFPDEGKSTIAKNLASAASLQGNKVLLVDGDLRNPSLTADLAGHPTVGLRDVVFNGTSLDEVTYLEEQSGMRFLPSSVRPHGPQTTDIFGAYQTQSAFDALKEKYDLVVVDFPPIGALSDALAANQSVDGYILVVKWGDTPRSMIREFILNHPNFADKCLGVVLNKVELRRLHDYGTYEGAPSGAYLQRYFGRS